MGEILTKLHVLYSLVFCAAVLICSSVVTYEAYQMQDYAFDPNAVLTDLGTDWETVPFVDVTVTTE